MATKHNTVKFAFGKKNPAIAKRRDGKTKLEKIIQLKISVIESDDIAKA